MLKLQRLQRDTFTFFGFWLSSPERVWGRGFSFTVTCRPIRESQLGRVTWRRLNGTGPTFRLSGRGLVSMVMAEAGGKVSGGEEEEEEERV